MKPKPVIVVQGAQWGSEAKGMVAAALCRRRNVAYAVRTGAVNAGHTVYKDGKKFVNQQLPTGWVHPDVDLIIGAGALVHPKIFTEEVEMVRMNGFRGRIYVDYRAGLHLEEHTTAAKLSGRHYKIGATGKGCSNAIIDRIKGRGDGEAHTFKDWMERSSDAMTFAPTQESEGFEFHDTVSLLHAAYDAGAQILLEGTQGTMLDLCLGPYPYTTHKQCIASQWVTEAGLSPSIEYEVVLVARTYPIRVAGNSGPMPQEIDWPTLAHEINKKRFQARLPFIVDPKCVEYFQKEWALQGEYEYASKLVELSERNRDALQRCPSPVVDELKKLFEFTTVTKKLRRIARLDMDTLKYSVMLNRPNWIALTFLNYEFPHLWGKPTREGGAELPAHEYMIGVEDYTGTSIRAYTTGPEDHNFHECPGSYDPE